MPASVPGYTVGTWVLDPVHSEVAFAVRHMMVSRVRGRFRTVEATLVTAEDPLASKVTASIDLRSVDTGNEQRDEHLRSGEFFGVDEAPMMTFESTSISEGGSGYLVVGQLTLRGVTKPFTLDVEPVGIGPDAYGGTRAGFSAKGKLNRKDFNVNYNALIEAGGVVVSDEVDVRLDLELVLQQ